MTTINDAVEAILNRREEAARTEQEQPQRAERQEQHDRIAEALQTYRKVCKELSKVEAQRREADKTVESLAQNATVKRWCEAMWIAMRAGFGHSFEIYAAWVKSMRTTAQRHAGECHHQNGPLASGSIARTSATRFDAGFKQNTMPRCTT